jgi:hypothetical protein
MPAVAPPRKRTNSKRRKELRTVLMLIAKRATPNGTFTALARKLNCDHTRMCDWINQGRVPPWRANQILNLEGVNKTTKEDSQEVTLADLTPDLAE